MKRMTRSSVPKTLSRIALLFLVVMATSAMTQAETGRCVAAQTPADVLLPDGSLHPAGRIELCMSQRFSPVAGLHVTRLADGYSGLFLSRRSRSEGMSADGKPYIQFFRADGGELILNAYAVPDGQDRMWLYQVRPIGKKKTKRHSDSSPTFALRDSKENDDTRIVLLAASAY